MRGTEEEGALLRRGARLLRELAGAFEREHNVKGVVERLTARELEQLADRLEEVDLESGLDLMTAINAHGLRRYALDETDAQGRIVVWWDGNVSRWRVRYKGTEIDGREVQFGHIDEVRRELGEFAEYRAWYPLPATMQSYRAEIESGRNRQVIKVQHFGATSHTEAFGVARDYLCSMTVLLYDHNEETNGSAYIAGARVSATVSTDQDFEDGE